MTKKEKRIVLKAIEIMEHNEDYSCFTLQDAEKRITGVWLSITVSPIVQKYVKFFEPKLLNSDSSAWKGLKNPYGHKEKRLMLLSTFLVLG